VKMSDNQWGHLNPEVQIVAKRKKNGDLGLLETKSSASEDDNSDQEIKDSGMQSKMQAFMDEIQKAEEQKEKREEEKAKRKEEREKAKIEPNRWGPWIEFFDESTKHPYFYNEKTKETVWQLSEETKNRFIKEAEDKLKETQKKETDKEKKKDDVKKKKSRSRSRSRSHSRTRSRSRSPERRRAKRRSPSPAKLRKLEKVRNRGIFKLDCKWMTVPMEICSREPLIIQFYPKRLRQILQNKLESPKMRQRRRS